MSKRSSTEIWVVVTNKASPTNSDADEVFLDKDEAEAVAKELNERPPVMGIKTTAAAMTLDDFVYEYGRIQMAECDRW